jgi:hypothetical protein
MCWENSLTTLLDSEAMSWFTFDHRDRMLTISMVNCAARIRKLGAYLAHHRLVLGWKQPIRDQEERTIRLATAATLASLMMAPLTGAIAQMGFPPMMPVGDMMGGGCAECLKSGLAITDAQKGVWDAYATALKNTPSGLTAMKDLGWQDVGRAA